MKESVLNALLDDLGNFDELTQTFGHKFLNAELVPAMLAEGEVEKVLEDQRWVGEVEGSESKKLGRHHKFILVLRGKRYEVYLFYASTAKTVEWNDRQNYRWTTKDDGGSPLHPPTLRNLSLVEDSQE